MKHILPFALLALANCATIDTVSRAEPQLIGIAGASGPPDASPGTCWGRDTTPAIYETVTENILLQPAEIGTDGSVRRPAAYKTETRQAIVRERVETWFERPCDAVLTPEFIASVQRALTARGWYDGPVTGALDAGTLRAIRAYQAAQGLNSAVLSTAAAQQLGLVAIRPRLQ